MNTDGHGLKRREEETRIARINMKKAPLVKSAGADSVYASRKQKFFELVLIREIGVQHPLDRFHPLGSH
jgi:hypothetical protein